MPPTASAGITPSIASAFGAVHMMTLAPPRRWRASPASSFERSIYSCAPSFCASSCLDAEDESATVWKPILRANWMPRWPRPLHICAVTKETR